MKRTIEFYDTTLRDGTQAENFNLSVDDKVRITKQLDKLGIDLMITSPWQGISTDGIAANETTLAAHTKYPNRILAYACANPNYNEDLDAVIEYHEKHKFIGIKPYWPYHKYDILGEKYSKWFEYGNLHKLFMLIHTGDAGIVEKTGVLAEKYPDITYILAHSGISYDVANTNIALAKKHKKYTRG